MRYLLYILLIIIGFVTSVLTWIFIQRVALDYNSEGRFYSPEEGIIYNEQAILVYGLLALLGLIFTGILIIKLFAKRKIQ